MELLLVRHGLPERVENEDGRPADPPLSTEGHDQAARVGRWLESEAPGALYASPLRRAQETAAPLAGTLGLDVGIEAGIVELDHQSDYYIPLETLKAEDYERWQALIQRGELYAGVDMERFRRDVVDCIEALIAKHAGQRIAIFCHGGVINAWAGHVLGIADPFFLDVGYTGVSRFLAASSGERSVRSLNELAHLRDA
ncbi:MAG: histidine phosphatase family protein [Myxococcota bacterium]